MICPIDKKPSVIYDVVPELHAAMPVIDRVYTEAKAKAVITSARDAKHSAKSVHSLGRAVDLRISNLFKRIPLSTAKEWWRLVFLFAEKLAITLNFEAKDGIRFFVVLESDHIHLEVARKGETPNIKGQEPGRYVYLTSEVKGFLT